MRDREDGDRQFKQIANEKNISDNAADVGREKEHKSELEVRECKTQERECERVRIRSISRQREKERNSAKLRIRERERNHIRKRKSKRMDGLGCVCLCDYMHACVSVSGCTFMPVCVRGCVRVLISARVQKRLKTE